MSARRAAGWTLALAWFLVAASSCSGRVVPAGGLYLVMCTDGTVHPNALHLVIRSGDGTRTYRKRDYDIPSTDLPTLPASLAIESNGNVAASLLIDVSVSKGETLLDVQHYKVDRIPTDRVTELDVVFTASCGTGNCDTCSTDGTCARDDVHADALPMYAGNTNAISKCHAPLDAGKETSGMADGGIHPPDASMGSDTNAPEAMPPDVASDVAPADAGSEVDAAVASDAGARCSFGAERCVGNSPQTCDATGAWMNAPSCVQGLTHCSGVRCVPVPPSCTGAPPGAGSDCSSAGNGDCCASYDVTGGTFFRDYDAVLNTERTSPATVSSFRLDAYEVTVGRFRQFVGAVIAGWRPDAGSGKHAHLRQGSGLVDVGDGGTASFETGWDASWTANLPATASAWDTQLSCFSGVTATWTPNQGVANEKLPMTCVDWYAAYAFCIWDGGFLPSTAEWNYAAAGGAEQRVYAWGNDPPAEDTALAIWGCYFGGGQCLGIVNVAPVGSARGGDGKWGHSDLTGSVWEWVLDYEADYFEPCIDCAATTGVGRVLRGAAFNNYIADLPVSHHLWSRMSHTNVGARCARVIP